MNTVQDFEDMLSLLEENDVRYLIIGGLAFIYHAKPRYTKDIDIWVDFKKDNIQKANKALTVFGSPALLCADDDSEVFQLGIAPNRIDFFLRVKGIGFEEAWEGRIRGTYGQNKVNWIGIDSLLKIKSKIDKPRHQEDARILKKVIKLRKKA